MKITICSHDGKGYFGGPYEWIKRFAVGLAEAGITLDFLLISDHSKKESSLYIYLKELGFSCSLLQWHSLTQYHDNTDDRVKWILDKVKNNPPDIFVANNILAALYAGKWIKEAGIPVIGVSHTDDPRNDWFLQDFIKGDKSFALSGVVCVSELLTRKISASNPYNLPVVTISCGTPISNTIRKAEENKLKIVYAGKLTEEAKQITLLTKAFCNAVRTIDGVEAYIYGDGDKRETVIEIIKTEAQGLPIYYKGLVSSKDLLTELAKYDVIVLLSDYEGLPVILLEGMSSGLVPVCLNIKSGIPEIVSHLQTGILVNDRSEEFLSGIKLLKADSELLELMSLTARKYVIENHSMEIVVKKWIEFSELLLSKTSAKKVLNTPSVLNLPPQHILLNGVDKRKVPFLKYLYGQVLRVKRIIKK